MDCDILMITYNRPRYTELCLSRLLETCDENTRVWIWHNGDHAETLEVVKRLAVHPRVHEFHHSKENKKLREPTNWLWQNAQGNLLGKVDDDCLVPQGWIQTLRQAHADVPKFGAISCWHFPPEDLVPELARKKVRTFGRHQIMANCWIGGSGYLLKRHCVEQQGMILEGKNFTDYTLSLAVKGWVNGWYWPFLYQDHLDDPRSAHTALKTQADFEQGVPLSARTFGCDSIEAWCDRLRAEARMLQEISPDPWQHSGWRPKVRHMVGRVKARLLRGR